MDQPLWSVHTPNDNQVSQMDQTLCHCDLFTFPTNNLVSQMDQPLWSVHTPNDNLFSQMDQTLSLWYVHISHW